MSANATTRIVTGAYPLLLAFTAGCAFIDQRYAHAHAQLGNATSRSMGDALLLVAVPVLLAGLLATAAGAGRARILFALSLAVFSLELLLPALVALLPGGAWLTQTGPLLRATVLLGALVLATLAQREVLR